MDPREPLLTLLDAHHPFDAHEAWMLRSIRAFVVSNPDCFERSLQVGHITGSAWIVDRERTHTLLHHHAKLDRWLQLGGHADGDSDILRVALREAAEESGLRSVRPVSAAIFDVDAHDIPARGAEPAHVHYDVRFLLEADRYEPLAITEESMDLAWVPLESVRLLNTDASVLRMVARTRK